MYLIQALELGLPDTETLFEYLLEIFYLAEIYVKPQPRMCVERYKNPILILR